MTQTELAEAMLRGADALSLSSDSDDRAAMLCLRAGAQAMREAVPACEVEHGPGRIVLTLPEAP